MIFRSPFPDIDIPEMAITSYVLRQATRMADKPALVDADTGRAITYGQLEILVRRLAIGLADRSFGKGDVLAIYSPNVLEYAVALHGAIAAGGAVTTINPMATAHELANQLNDSRAVYLVAAPALLPNALQAAEWSHVRETFVFGEAEGVRSFNVLLANDGPWPDVTISSREDVAMLPYSSGTTGLPKGVMLTHYNLIANFHQVDGFQLLTEDDDIVFFLPFYHIYGLYVALCYGLAEGATLVIMPRFDLEQYLQLLQNYRSARAFVVPPVALALANHPVVDRYDISSLRFILTAAAPAGPELCAAIQTRLGSVVKQAYGMTELSPISHLVPESAPRVGAGGVPVRNTEVKVVDIDTGRELGSHKSGEIWVRGPQVMKGYVNSPDATAETITAEGWLKTGDIGYADEDGYIHIVDRLKELIKYKGYQVAPAELEAVLLSHPAIADAAVIPSPDQEAGEVPKAFVVLRSDADPEEIMAFVAERVARYKRIRLIEFTDQIPRSASGKILRRVLVESERERLSTPV
jgi:acyl-CoA synthetase (AMP-forming)/AMP-acid ligase II